MVKISPSLLAADFTRLGEEVSDISKSGADMLHLDVMDGRFVTNISFGFPVIEALRKKSDMVFDVHLMIDSPEIYAERFLKAGADILTFHIEATEKVRETLEMIRAAGKRAALSVKPGTPIEAVYPYLDACDMVLVMTVEPGYGGQALIPYTIDKVRALRKHLDDHGYDIDVQVDGGITADNAGVLVDAGANILVAGSSVFKASDRKAAIDALRK
jgi:ribulose-phosphate 3-epimerase